MADSRVIDPKDSEQPEPSGLAALDPNDADVTVIRARKGWLAIDLGEFWHYRELLYFLVWRDIKVRYKQTVLGAAWAIIQPVFTMVIFTVIFGRIDALQFPGAPYAIALYAGQLPWMLFSSIVASAGASLVNQAPLLTKIYFPRLFMPTSSAGTALVDFAFSFCVYVFLMIYYEHTPGWSVALLPALLLLTMMAGLGVGYLLAGLTVTYRDFRYVIPFMLQAWFFASPIIYPLSDKIIPHKYWLLAAINPMVGIIEAFRSVLLDQPIKWDVLGVSTLVTCALFVFGLYNFRRTERRFADVA
jgi:lipopolysaccharide transport system permease protein